MRRRASLAMLMGLVAVLAVGLALIKVAPEGSPEWAGFLFLLALLVGTLALIVRRDRAPWVGFTLFGWTYALVALVPPFQAALRDRLPSDETVDRLVLDHLHPVPPGPADPLGFSALRINDSYYKFISDPFNGTQFQPTPEEARLIDVYTAQVEAWKHRRGAFDRARGVFYQFAGLAFALLGAVAGRVLSDRDRPAELRPSPQPG